MRDVVHAMSKRDTFKSIGEAARNVLAEIRAGHRTDIQRDKKGDRPDTSDAVASHTGSKRGLFTPGIASTGLGESGGSAGFALNEEASAPAGRQTAGGRIRLTFDGVEEEFARGCARRRLTRNARSIASGKLALWPDAGLYNQVH